MVDEVVVIVGASGGIGRAITERVATKSRGVVLAYHRSSASAEELARCIRGRSGNAIVLQTDVADPAAVDALLEGTVREYGRVDALIHSASAPIRHSRFDKASWAEFEAHWSVQVKGAFNLVQSFLPELRKASGQVIFVLSSYVLHHPPVQVSPYVTAKYGLLGLARCLGVELIKDGVRVNMISPYLTPTPLSSGLSPRALEILADAHPMRRLATVENTAAAIEFLLSPGASYLHLVNIPVCGGLVS
jgi:3-oxoacyl-[acyl-carrier protein] reductase